MELLVCGLFGWVAYALFRGNTKRGVETVRAHVFLGGLASGASVQEANYAASYDAATGPTEVIQSAILHLKASYGGKQTAMISEAYRKGMTPRLPLAYRTFFINQDVSDNRWSRV